MTTFADLDIGCPLKLPPENRVRQEIGFLVAVWNDADCVPENRTFYGVSPTWARIYVEPLAIKALLADRNANPHGNEEP